jgi:hypothetical protein
VPLAVAKWALVQFRHLAESASTRASVLMDRGTALRSEIPIIAVRGDVGQVCLLSEQGPIFPRDDGSGLAAHRRFRGSRLKEDLAGAWAVAEFLRASLKNHRIEEQSLDVCGDGRARTIQAEVDELLLMQGDNTIYVTGGGASLKASFSPQGTRLVLTFQPDRQRTLRGVMNFLDARQSDIFAQIAVARLVVTPAGGRRRASWQSDVNLRLRHFWLPKMGTSRQLCSGFAEDLELVQNGGSAQLRLRGARGTSHTVRLTQWVIRVARPDFDIDGHLARRILEIASKDDPEALRQSPIASVHTYSLPRYSTEYVGLVRSTWRVSPPSNEDPVFRIRDALANELPTSEGSPTDQKESRLQEARSELRLAIPPLASPPEMLVIEDMDFGFRKCPPSSQSGTSTQEHDINWLDCLRFVEENCDQKCNLEAIKPNVIVILSRTLPDLDSDQMQWRDELWRKLASDKHRRRVLVVVSAQLLRASGLKLSHRISWERSAEDLVREFKHNRVLARLGDFGHILVRFGISGIFYRFRDGTNVRDRIFFEPNGYGPDPSDQGKVLGKNAVIAACVAKHLIEAKDLTPAPDIVSEGAKEAIRRTQLLFIHGLGDESFLDKPLWSASAMRNSVFAPQLDRSVLAARSDPEQLVGTARVPETLEDLSRWKILADHARGAEDELAFRIACEGAAHVLNTNCPTLPVCSAPIAKFGAMAVVDRKEIESYRSFERMVKNYLKSDEDKPLSIAVFGPPGSGKSFGVREVVKSVSETVDVQEYNLAQFSVPGDLITPLLYVRNAVTSAVTPLVFFDEFDAALKGVELGWLRYFLAPMQDGRFKHGERMMAIGKAIFVFAGGTRRTFEAFSQVDDSVAQKAKIPDFISRLRGYINMVGINSQEDDSLFIVRRAVQLHSMLVERKLACKKTGRSLVDPDFLRGLLKVSNYNHGARSLRAVLDACVDREGAIRMPTPAQLDVHVEGHRFWQFFQGLQSPGSDHLVLSIRGGT